VTTKPTNPLIAARRNDSDRRRRKVIDALDRLRTGGKEITVSAVARTAGSIARSCIATTTCAPRSSLSPPSPNRTRPAPASADGRCWPTSPTSVNTTNASATRTPISPSGCPKSSANRSSTGLTRTDETSTLRKRVAELEQRLLDRRQDLQDRDDELAAARAANRDLITTLNGRTR
jgi:hypothetical protein